MNSGIINSITSCNLLVISPESYYDARKQEYQIEIAYVWRCNMLLCLCHNTFPRILNLRWRLFKKFETCCNRIHNILIQNTADISSILLSNITYFYLNDIKVLCHPGVKLGSFTIQVSRTVIFTTVSVTGVKKRHLVIITKKRIPSILNDESTESFICLRRHIYMPHVLLLCISFLRVLVVLYLRVTCICVA
jgi:hypothetical protein